MMSQMSIQIKNKNNPGLYLIVEEAFPKIK